MICRRMGSKPDMYLEVMEGSDGDIFVSVGKIGGNEYTVDFPNQINGGGRSPHTYEALQVLLKAIQKDNENEDGKGDKDMPCV